MKLKFLITIIVTIILFTSSLTIVPNPVSAADPMIVNNQPAGEIEVFAQDYSSTYMVPTNMFLGLDTEPGIVENTTLSYDYTNRCINIDATYPSTGKLVICGLTPAVRSNLTIDLEVRRSNFNSNHYIYYGRGWIAVQVLDGSPDYLRVISYYYNPELESIIKDITDLQPTPNNWARFNMTIASDFTSRTNNIYINNRLEIQSPMSDGLTGLTAYTEYCAPYLVIKPQPNSEETGLGMSLHSISQRVPGNSYVSSIGNPNIVAFGIDGPHPYNYVDDGLALLRSTGCKGTIWADPGHLASYSEENITALKALLAEGWELGMHTSQSLNSKTMTDAISHLNQQYLAVQATFGKPPVSWCSYQNDDNVTHANYAYANLGIVWRNGYTGIHGIFANIGNMMDSNWATWWSIASAAGFAGPVFTHRLDEEPAISYSISYSNLSRFISNYAARNMSIVSYYEYWTYAQNTYHTTISDLAVVNGSFMEFSVANIGGKSRLLIDAEFAELVLDANGNEIPFTTTDDGIIIEVGPGEYRIMTEQYYRQMKIGQAISPLVSIIPMVVILAMVSMILSFISFIKKF